MHKFTEPTADQLLLAHIQHTNAGTGTTRRRRIDPAAWIVTAALLGLSLLTVAFGGG